MYVLPQAAILHPTAAMLILSVEQQLSALPIITWIQYFPKKGFQPEERLETRVSAHQCNKEKSGCRGCKPFIGWQPFIGKPFFKLKKVATLSQRSEH